MSKPFKFLLSLSTALVIFAPVSHAQNSGYTPPPMFDDMTPPMVRPETNTGNIVEKLESPTSDLPPVPSKRPVITPRVSVDPNSSRQVAPTPAPAVPSVHAPMPAAPAPTVTTAPVPQQPVVQPTAPTAPPKMQPIIDPRDVKKSAAPSKPKVEKPKVSKPVAPPPIPAKKPVIESPKVNAPENVPAPETTIDAPQVPATPEPPKTESKAEEPKKVETPVPTPPQPSPIAPEPEAEPIVTPAPKTEEPVQRDPKESAIKGPKTMPALPTENIDQQQTFEAKESPKEEPTILERHQQEAEQKKEELKPVVPAPKADVAPASFDQNNQGALKKTIPFQQGQIGLSSAEIDPIAAGVVKELDREGKEDWRVQIRAYATPYGTGVSSDKRIALSRALSLRSALIQQGVPAARIDVLAEGLQSENSSQPDRIDLYMYGPAAD